MSGIAPGADPSMEDILASIRRILSEGEAPGDDAAAEAAPPEPAAAPLSFPPAMAPATAVIGQPATVGVDDVFQLDESMLVDAPVAPIVWVPPVEPPAAAIKEALMSMSSAEPPAGPPAVSFEPEEGDVYRAAELPPGLIGAAAADVTASSIMSLVRTVSAERATAVYRGGPTLEDIVREEMRPLLKEWLDRHLPPLVERLVRAEIERVVSRVAP